MTIKIAVLASTNATDMQGLIDAIGKKSLDAKIVCLISNKDSCGAVERAKKHGIETIFIDSKGIEREEFDKKAAKELDKRNTDIVLLIGYMRFLSPWFIKHYENKIMNIHPSLLPAFAGGMDKSVHEEVLKRGCKITGCTLHFVDEGADTGPIIIQKCVKVDENETAETLKSKVQEKEVEAFIEGIKLFQKGKLKVKNGIVKIE